MTEQHSRKRIHRTRWVDIAAALLLLFICYFGITSLISFVQYRSLQFGTSQQASMEVTEPAQMLVLRDEHLLRSGVIGEVTPVIAAGERVKDGTVIAHIVSEGGVHTMLTAKYSGVVSYTLDGWEEHAPGEKPTLKELDAIFDELNAEPVADDADDTEEIITSNSGRAKIIDNLRDYQLYLQLPGDADLHLLGSKLSLYLEDGTLIKGSIINKLNGDDCHYLVAKIDSSYDVLLSIREQQVEVVTETVSGIMVPYQAVYLDADGNCGIYYKHNGRLAYALVEVERDLGEYLQVSGIVAGKTIVLNPAKAREGQKVYKK